jgi:hypothetical protein
MRCRFPCICVTWLLPAGPGQLAAEDIVFPDDAGVIDVTKPPYSAKGDGHTDAAEAIQQAPLEHGSANKIIYLPNKVYRLSTTLRRPDGDNETSQRATILQGQSREGTRLVLMDYSPGFNNPGRPILGTIRRRSRRRSTPAPPPSICQTERGSSTHRSGFVAKSGGFSAARPRSFSEDYREDWPRRCLS